MLKDSIIYKGRIIEYEWTKGKRKTIGISVNEMGKIIVRAPYSATRIQVMSCVEKHILWIIDKIDKKKQELKISEKKEDVFFYLGKNYQLKKRKDFSIKGENRARILRDEKEKEIVLFYNGPEWTTEEIKGALEQWYREEARAYLTMRTDYYSRKIGVTYNDIRIKDQKTRWGSCSSLGNINYNWRIIMAPPEIVDYLVVHELCHRKEMNHSEAFWALVKKELPDAEKRKKWLKDNSRMLAW